MRFKRLLILSCIFIGSCTRLFSHSYESELIPSISESISHIVAYAPEVIKGYNNDRFYLDEGRVSRINSDMYLLSANHFSFYMTPALMFSDENGLFLSTSYIAMGKKIFIQHCNNCGYEWEGGLFALRCPKCGSKDISNVLNK